MAVQRRVNWISQQRVDVPDMRSVESAASNDFDQLIQAVITGTSQGYIIRGFNILMANAVGGASNALQMQVDPGALLHIAASQSGTVFMVPVGTDVQPLNSATNSNVIGAFAPSSINYVTLDYARFIDPATNAQVFIWNPTSNVENTINAPRAQILKYTINISTVSPPANLLPVAIVITDAGNNVVSITDSRWMLYRLATGGAVPNPFYVYPWTNGRTETSPTSTSNSIDPFTGGDKNILSLKEWMNAVMTSLLEIKGTTFWYSSITTGNLTTIREDLGNTVITGSGNISHGIIPNSEPILITTGDLTLFSNQLTNLASVAGLVAGQYIFGTGIPAQTTIISIIGNTVTMSEEATLNGTGISVSFYDPSVITGPGQINWDEDISIRVIGSSLNYVIAANPDSANIVLSDDEVAYFNIVRDVLVSPNLIFTNGSQTVNSVGAVAWTALLQAGDFVKLAADTHSEYYEIQIVNSPSQVTLVDPFAGTSTGAGGAQSHYAFGNYQSAAIPSTDRDIFIANRADVPPSGDLFWLFLREDNGGDPRVYIRFLGAELDNGEDREVSGTTSLEVLRYIGSPSAAAFSPQYVSAIDPGSLIEQTLITVGSTAQTTPNSYFTLNSSNNARRYYVWWNIDGLGVDPNPGVGTNASIEVPIITGNTAVQNAAALELALNDTPFNDFFAVQQANPNDDEVLVSNTSAGFTSDGTSGNMAVPFTLVIQQDGTGRGNNFIKDGDNLTLAIKELDYAFGNFIAAVDEPVYDENIDIVTAGEIPPDSLNGPILAGTLITLPNNSRLGNIPQKYTVGKGNLEVYLNGQYLRLGVDWDEVGAPDSLSTQYETLIDYVVGDSIEVRIAISGGGAGGIVGPPGPTGPAGPPGANAVGGPVAISTKVANYPVLLTDNVLLADCTGTAIIFTLPDAATATGRVYFFKKIDVTANAMTIQAFGLQLIDGSNTVSTTTQYQAFMLICDGTFWWIF